MKATRLCFRRMSFAFIVIYVIVGPVSCAADSNYTSPNELYENSTLTSDDEYIKENEKNCFTSRRILACVKFKTAKFLWKLASNSYSYFPNDYSRGITDNHLKIVHLSQPSGIAAFENARSLDGLYFIYLIAFRKKVKFNVISIQVFF